MHRPNPYQQIAGQLNIDDAIIAASAHNDLLPPRREAKVGGELGKRFSAYLVRELETGRYDPIPAHIIAVPKSQLATRPAALMPFADRVVYEAIVAVLRPRIVCAVERRAFLAGANPARQLSLQPVAARAVCGGNDMS